MARSKSKRHPIGGGRKSRAGAPSTSLIAVRLTDKERDTYRDEAEAEGVSLGEWVRTACSAAMSSKNRRAIAKDHRNAITREAITKAKHRKPISNQGKN